VITVTQVALGVPLELLQYPGADLLGVVILAVDVDLPTVVAHVALYRADRALGIGDALALGDLSYHHLAGAGESHDGWGGPAPLGVGDDSGFTSLENGDNGVGGAEIDADSLGHVVPPGIESPGCCHQYNESECLVLKFVEGSSTRDHGPRRHCCGVGVSVGLDLAGRLVALVAKRRRSVGDGHLRPQEPPPERLDAWGEVRCDQEPGTLSRLTGNGTLRFSPETR
jgi:hypothetical protein